MDCTNVCNGSAVIDECGVCDGDGTSCNIYGCMDETACNYNSNANIDDGNCLINDCAGECGGSAMEDECGMCGGNGLIEGYDCQGTPILFGHTGSFLQGFYYISTGAFIDGIEIDALDWIGAFNGDVVSCFF